MKKNMGKIDKVLRILIAVVIGILIFAGAVQGAIAIILGVVGVVFLITSFASFCPAYLPLGLNTCARKDGKT